MDVIQDEKTQELLQNESQTKNRQEQVASEQNLNSTMTRLIDTAQSFQHTKQTSLTPLEMPAITHLTNLARHPIVTPSQEEPGN